MLSQQTTEQRYVIFASAALAIIVVATWLGVSLFGPALAESIVAGSGPFAYLQGNALRLLVGVAPEDQATELFAQMQTILGRLTTVYVFVRACCCGEASVIPICLRIFLRPNPTL